MNLDELRAALAPRVGEHAAFDGWTAKAVGMAAGAARRRPPTAPGSPSPGGQSQMIDAWFDWRRQGDARAPFRPSGSPAMKIRERIRELVLFRLEAMAPAPRGAAPRARHPRHAAERCRRRRGSPGAAPTGSGGSPATPRPTSTITPSALILVGVYGSTILVFLDDESEDWPRPAPSSTAGSTTSCASRSSRRAGAARASAARAQPLPRPPALPAALS